MLSTPQQEGKERTVQKLIEAQLSSNSLGLKYLSKLIRLQLVNIDINYAVNNLYRKMLNGEACAVSKQCW